MPAGAGAKSVAKPASIRVAAPLDGLSSNNDRFPVASGGTLSGLTATQQSNPSCDSNTRRTVCTAPGSCDETPPPGCCHMACTPTLPLATEDVDPPPPPPPPPPQAESASR